MPTLDLTEDKAKIVVDALRDRRGLMMQDWAKAYAGEGALSAHPMTREEICEMIDTEIAKVVCVRTLIEDAIKVQKGVKTRAEVAAEHGFDIKQIDAANAADEERLASITEQEAKRRVAVAKMIIAEVEAAETVRTLGIGGMIPGDLIHAYMKGLHSSAAEEHNGIQIDINVDGNVYSGHVDNDVADQLANLSRRT